MLQVEQREGDRSFCEEDFEMDLEEKQALIHSYLKKKAEGNAIVLKQAQTRNIIFLGRTRSGKIDVSLSTVTVFRFVSTVFLTLNNSSKQANQQRCVYSRSPSSLLTRSPCSRLRSIHACTASRWNTRTARK